MSDPSSSLSRFPAALPDLHFLVQMLTAKDVKSGALWASVALVTKMCARSDEARAFFRDRCDRKDRI